jgi:hypothetical protein
VVVFATLRLLVARGVALFCWREFCFSHHDPYQSAD